MSMYDQHYQRYVAGFAFDPMWTKVALVLKQKPDWQRGKLNAIGGKIEPFDLDDEAAMVREFWEETGAGTEIWQWTRCVNLKGPTSEVVFYRTHMELSMLRTRESEPIMVLDTREVQSYPTVPNLKWLLPLVMDRTIEFPIDIKDTK